MTVGDGVESKNLKSPNLLVTPPTPRKIICRPPFYRFIVNLRCRSLVGDLSSLTRDNIMCTCNWGQHWIWRSHPALVHHNRHEIARRDRLQTGLGRWNCNRQRLMKPKCLSCVNGFTSKSIQKPCACTLALCYLSSGYWVGIKLMSTKLSLGPLCRQTVKQEPHPQLK